MFTNYWFMPNPLFSIIVLPLPALSVKPGVLLLCTQTERKSTTQYSREGKIFHLNEGEKMVAN